MQVHSLGLQPQHLGLSGFTGKKLKNPERGRIAIKKMPHVKEKEMNNNFHEIYFLRELVQIAAPSQQNLTCLFKGSSQCGEVYGFFRHGKRSVAHDGVHGRGDPSASVQASFIHRKTDR